MAMFKTCSVSFLFYIPPSADLGPSGNKDDLSTPLDEPSLSDIIAAVIHASSSPRTDKYFRPPPEARYVSNRNVYKTMESPMASVASYEQPLVPSDIQLDSTKCTSNFDPPITFVSNYIESLCLHNWLYIVLHWATALQHLFRSCRLGLWWQHLWK